MDKKEEARNKLNFEIRCLLSLINLIKDENLEYPNYKENTMTEEEFLEEQTKLIINIRERLTDIFK